MRAARDLLVYYSPGIPVWLFHNNPETNTGRRLRPVPKGSRIRRPFSVNKNAEIFHYMLNRRNEKGNGRGRLGRLTDSKPAHVPEKGK